MGIAKNIKELSRIDYLILGALRRNDALNPMFGLTIKEMGITEVQRPCIWKHLNELVGRELVCQSGNYGKQKMYYITQAGVNLLNGGNANV